MATRTLKCCIVTHFSASLAHDILYDVKRQSDKRVVMAWASPNQSGSAAQLKNKSWEGIFDGIQAFCGVGFEPNGTGLTVNQTQWKACSDLRNAAIESDIEFHLCIAGQVPDAAISAPHALIKKIITLAKENKIKGISLDDEYDCAPRSTLDRFEKWVGFVDILTEQLHHIGLQVSAAVQAIYGIQEVPYQPHCGPNKSPSDCSQACNRNPGEYPLEEKVISLASNSKIDRWLEMDTYYFTTGRFLGALDWYLQHIPREKLGIGLRNRNDLSMDGLTARFYAMDRIDWINVFILPANDEWLEFLRRWKTQCAGCGVQSTLGCYDLSLSCDSEVVTVEQK